MMRVSRAASAHVRGTQRGMMRWTTFATRVGARGHVIQKLFEQLNGIRDIDEAAARPRESPELMKCLAIMNTVRLPDVGLDKDDLSSLKESVCMSIYSSNKFDISIFIVPVGLAMPLHDHPNMAVLSKLLLGSALCTSYTKLHPMAATHDGESFDDMSPSDDGPFFKRDVKVKDSHSDAWFLTPTDGNVHAVHSLHPQPPSAKPHPVVMLDILLPPYDSLIRPCRFYTPSGHPLWVPTSSFGLAGDKQGTMRCEGGHGELVGEQEWKWKKWILEEIEEPTELLPYGVPYHGPVPNL